MLLVLRYISVNPGDNAYAAIILFALGYVLAIKLHWGAPGIGAAFGVAWIVGTAVLVKRLYKRVNA